MLSTVLYYTSLINLHGPDGFIKLVDDWEKDQVSIIGANHREMAWVMAFFKSGVELWLGTILP